MGTWFPGDAAHDASFPHIRKPIAFDHLFHNLSQLTPIRFTSHTTSFAQDFFQHFKGNLSDTVVKILGKVVSPHISNLLWV